MGLLNLNGPGGQIKGLLGDKGFDDRLARPRAVNGSHESAAGISPAIRNGRRNPSRSSRLDRKDQVPPIGLQAAQPLIRWRLPR
jgi:hypothetical protein